MNSWCLQVRWQFPAGDPFTQNLGQARALETVIQSDDPTLATGLFFHEQSVEAINEAISNFESLPEPISAQACRRQAERFAPARFRKEISSFIEAKLRKDD